MISQNRINQIIEEETNKVMIEEGVLSSVKDYIRNLLNFRKKKKDKKEDDSKDDNEHKGKHDKPLSNKKRHEKKGKGKENDIKTKKGVKGSKITYNYKDYLEKYKGVSKADARALIDSIDQERTNIRDLARIIFPNHTEAGGQSQLRKILNGERRMTKRVYHLLSKLMASGEIARKG